MQLRYHDYKRRKVGQCNICQRNGRLTWDHVPPKGGIELRSVEIDRVLSRFNPSFRTPSREASAEGLRYRTLCQECNSSLSVYDTALNSFALSVGRILNSVLAFPAEVHIEARATAIVRAILAHLLAARLSDKDSFFDSITRRLIQHPEDSIPTEINVFYWLYPYSDQVILRSALMPRRRGRFSEFQQFGLVKYFPIAYLVTDAPQYEGLSALTTWRNEPATATANLPVDIKGVHDVDWPEAPADGPSANFLYVGGEGFESLRAHPHPVSIIRVQPSKDND